MPTYITTHELLNFLKISRSTLYDLRKNVTFPVPRKIGKRRLVWSLDEIAAWTAAQ